MSEQRVTEAENPCISSASKTLGQVGYEAMLAKMRDDRKKAGQEWFPDIEPELDEQIGAWENQAPKLREDWEMVATAIEIAIKEKLVKEVAEQMGAKL